MHVNELIFLWRSQWTLSTICVYCRCSRSSYSRCSRKTNRLWCSWCNSRQRSFRDSMVSRPFHPQCWCTAVAHSPVKYTLNPHSNKFINNKQRQLAVLGCPAHCLTIRLIILRLHITHPSKLVTCTRQLFLPVPTLSPSDLSPSRPHNPITHPRVIRRSQFFNPQTNKSLSTVAGYSCDLLSSNVWPTTEKVLSDAVPILTYSISVISVSNHVVLPLPVSTSMQYYHHFVPITAVLRWLLQFYHFAHLHAALSSKHS